MLTVESTDALLGEQIRLLGYYSEMKRIDGRPIVDLDAIRRRIASLEKHRAMLISQRAQRTMYDPTKILKPTPRK